MILQIYLLSIPLNWKRLLRKLKKSGSTWSFGCKTFDQETLERVIHLGVSSIEVEGNTVTHSQLQDILKYIK